eukprot:4128632-Alexandrium_andersonii.AAC.1
MTEAAGVHLSLNGLPCFDGNALWDAVYGIPERLHDAVHLKSLDPIRENLGEFFVNASVFAWNFFWPCDAPASALTLEFMRQQSHPRTAISDE